MNEWVWLLIFYAVEGMLVLIWWKAVCQKEKALPRLGRRLFHQLKNYFLFFLQVVLGKRKWDSSEELQAFQSRKKSLLEKHLVTVYLSVCILLLSPVLTCFSAGDDLFSKAFFLSVMISLAVGQLWGSTTSIQEAMGTVGEMVGFLERHPRFFEEHSGVVEGESSASKWKYTFAVVLSVSISLAGMLIPTDDPKVWGILQFLLLGWLCWKVWEFLSKRRKAQRCYQLQEKKIRITDWNLTRFQEDLENMCAQLQIDDLELSVCSGQEANAYSEWISFQTPKVIFSSALLNRFVGISQEKDLETMDNMVKAVLGHELVHIAHQDTKRMRWRIRIAVLAGLVVGYVLLFCLARFLPFLMLPALPFLVLFLFLSGIFTDARYWQQISELRADKKGSRISGSPTETLVQYWEVTGVERQEAEAVKKIDCSNFLYRRYKRYQEAEAHPCIEWRKKNLVKNAEWGLPDYARLLGWIAWSRLRRRGWNGR